MLNIENLNYLRNSLMAERARLSASLAEAPHAHLVGRKRSADHYQIYIRDDSGVVKDVYVNNSLKPEASRIAHYMFVKEKIHDLDNQINALDMVIDAFSGSPTYDALLQKYPWMQSLLAKPKSNEERLAEWKMAEYTRNMDHPENLKHTTVIPGLSARSKSEADIISRLEHFDVPYRYDVVLDFNGARINMDFICINVGTGKMWYWDHRGMMDNSSYIEKTLYCERILLHANIVEGINLIITSETADHPLNIQEIDEKIQFYLL